MIRKGGAYLFLDSKDDAAVVSGPALEGRILERSVRTTLLLQSELDTENFDRLRQSADVANNSVEVGSRRLVGQGDRQGVLNRRLGWNV